MIKVAKEYKLVALDVAKGESTKLAQLGQDPLGFANSKIGYLKSNVRRAATTKESKGKASMPRKRKRAATQEDEGVGKASNTPGDAIDNENTGAPKAARRQPSRATKKAKAVAKKDAESEGEYIDE